MFNFKKTLIAILVFTVFVLPLSACSNSKSNNEDNNNADKNLNTDTSISVFSEARTENTTGGVNSTDNLNNTYYRLKNEKSLKIGYFGGSVTAGMSASEGNAWTDNITGWFESNFPLAEITEINAAQGNRSSLWGYFRIDQDLLTEKPDLIFIELAINDEYQSFYSETSNGFFTEGIISKIRTQLPQTEIVMVLITDEHLKTDYTALETHIKIAEHYGIPYINVGKALSDEIGEKGLSYTDYIVDNVHPNDKGHKVYSNCIEKFLSDKLIENPPELNGIENKPVPENDLFTNSTKSSQILTAQEISELTDTSEWTLMNSPSNSVRNFGPSLYGLDGYSFTIEFEGKALCAMVDAKMGSLIECNIDGETVSAMVPVDIRSEICLTDNLNYGKHTATITVKTSERFIIGALLIAK